MSRRTGTLEIVAVALAGFLGGVAVLSGCSERPTAMAAEPALPAERDLGAVETPAPGRWMVVTSPETGCEFIIIRDRGGGVAITPNAARFHDLTTFHRGCRPNTMNDQ